MEPSFVETPPAPSPAPVVEMPPAPLPVPAAAAPTPAVPQFGAGGQPSSGSFKDFFRGVSFTDVGMIALATAGMISIIYYYRQRIKHLKEEKTTGLAVQKDVEEIKVNVMNALGANYKKF